MTDQERITEWRALELRSENRLRGANISLDLHMDTQC